jgi:hypothetical protein
VLRNVEKGFICVAYILLQQSNNLIKNENIFHWLKRFESSFSFKLVTKNEFENLFCVQQK